MAIVLSRAHQRGLHTETDCGNKDLGHPKFQSTTDRASSAHCAAASRELRWIVRDEKFGTIRRDAIEVVHEKTLPISRETLNYLALIAHGKKRSLTMPFQQHLQAVWSLEAGCARDAVLGDLRPKIHEPLNSGQMHGSLVERKVKSGARCEVSR